MATNFLTLRNTQQYNTGGSTITDGSISITSTNKQWWTTTLGQTLNYSTLTGSTISAGSLTGSTINFTSNVLALGPSTTITPGANLSNGTWSTWATAKNSMTNVRKVASSSTGQYRLILIGVAGTSALWLSSDSGVTWSQCTAYGLPAGSAYDYRCGSISADGAYITIGVYGDTLYTSTDSGATFNNPAPGSTPYSWLRFENSFTDLGSGGATITPTTGGNAPTFSSTVVPQSGSAYSMRLTNTLGSGATASQYVRGTWAGSSNWTVSFWFNMQSYSSAQAQSVIFSAYTGTLLIIVYNASISIYSNGAVQVSTSSIPATNTWYYVTYIHQNNGTCSFYLNNTLVGTYVNSGGLGSASSFSLGTYDSGTNSPYNGFIDDFRLYNTALTYQNVRLAPYAWLKFENSTADAMGAITPTVTGSVTYVPGVVGNSAVVLANTAGGTATNYIRGAWAGAPNFTVSFWFNLQSLGVAYQNMFTSYTSAWAIDISSDRLELWNGGSQVVSSKLSLNTWYHAFGTFIANGTGALYLNGSLIDTYSCGASAGTSSGLFGLGTNDNNTVNAGNVYIDDLRIYNAAVLPPNASATNQLMTLNHNWSQIALSGSGQYQLAATDYGYLYKSADYGATWSASVGATGGSSTGCVKNLTMSHSGQYMLANAQKWVTPQQTGLSAATWSQGGVSWTASASTTSAGGYSVYGPFDTVVAGAPANSWNSPTTYNLSGAYTGAVSTTVLGGVGAVTGEYLQLQSSVPLVLSTYSIRAGGYWQSMKTGYLVGSTDGINWYPLQNISYAANPYTVNYTTTVGTIQVNYTGTQSVTANTMVSATTTAYSTSATAYTYFRLITQTIFSGVSSADGISINEFYPNFLAANTYTPQQPQTGTGTATWSVNGVTYTASASSTFNQFVPAFFAFDTSTYGWRSSSVYAINNGAYTGSNSTTIQTIGTVSGECLQLQSSIPLVMSSYNFASGQSYVSVPSSYYIVGSNDNGTTWYPLHRGVFGATNPYTNIQATPTSSNIIINYTGTQYVIASTTGTLTTTSYSYSTQAFLLFRLCILSVFSAPAYTADIGEWYINFLGGQTYSTNYGSTWSVVPTTYLAGPTAISGSGQYQIGANNTPLLARLTLDNTAVDSMGGLTAATGAGTVTYSTSIVKVGTHSAYFPNTAGASSNLSYLRYTTPTSLYTPASLTMSCWIYPTAIPGSGLSLPLGFSDGTSIGGTGFYISTGASLRFAYTGTTSGYSELIYSTTISTNTWYHVVGTMNAAGAVVLYVNGAAVASGTYTGLICIGTANNMTQFWVGAQYTSGAYPGGYAGYVDDVRLYPYALSPEQVRDLYNGLGAQAITLTNNYLASITSAPSVTPILTGNTSTFIDTATSYTGQYMIVVTAATSGSNVYYSTNYGSTWTGLSVGLASAPLVSCAMSYDGSYATVASSTVVYTLNNNGTGFTVALGAQAGAVAQGANSIAIGNKAGIVNQAASSIVMNATGSTLTACGPGFYVAPIQTANAAATTSASGYVNLLGYGDDRQVVQGSSVGINQATGGLRIIYGSAPNMTANNTQWSNDNALCMDRSDGGWNTGDLGAMVMFRQLWYSGSTGASNVVATGGISGTKTYGNGNFGGGLAFHYQPNGSNTLVQGMTLHSNSNLYTNTIAPNADNAYYCGLSGLRWAAVYAVNGTIQTSDSSVKDAQPLPYGINEILQMRTIKFKWKSQADLPDDDPAKNFEYYGFCADELSPLFPELVYDENKEVPVQMNYAELLPVVVNAMKEEHSVITGLSAASADHTAAIGSQSTTIATLSTASADHTDAIASQAATLSTLSTASMEHTAAIASQAATLSTLSTASADHTVILTTLSTASADQATTITGLQSTIVALQEQVSTLVGAQAPSQP